MLGLRRPTSLALRRLRPLHSTVPTANYVGPPDPVSNIRPVLYNDLGSTTTAESPQKHPYSLDEFRNDDSEDTLEYQWKLQRQQLDAFNDAFWRDVRFFFSLTHPAGFI
jgi:apoptogenic protein 1